MLPAVSLEPARGLDLGQVGESIHEVAVRLAREPHSFRGIGVRGKPGPSAVPQIASKLESRYEQARSRQVTSRRGQPVEKGLRFLVLLEDKEHSREDLHNGGRWVLALWELRSQYERR